MQKQFAIKSIRRQDIIYQDSSSDNEIFRSIQGESGIKVLRTMTAQAGRTAKLVLATSSISEFVSKDQRSLVQRFMHKCNSKEKFPTTCGIRNQQ